MKSEITKPPSAHHLIEFWNTAALQTSSSATGGTRKHNARKGGGPTPIQTAKEACAKAIRLNEPLRMVGRYETIFCAQSCDFFEDRPELAKPRAEVFKMSEKTQNLRWIIQIYQLDNLLSMLPPDWNVHRYRNVCFCLDLKSDDAEALESIEKFKKIPVAVRIIHVGPLCRPLDLAGKLNDIDWLVVDGGPLPQDSANDPSLAWLLALKKAAEKCGAAFFYHRDGVATDLDGGDWPNHPFGDKIDLSRPALPRSESILPVVAVGAAASDLTSKSSGNHGPEDEATLPDDEPADTETLEPVKTDEFANSVKLDATPVTPPPEGIISTTPATPAAAPAKPKRTGRARKPAPQDVADATTIDSDATTETASDPIPANEIVVIGKANGATDDSGGDEAVEVEVMPAEKPEGKATAKSRNKLPEKDLADFQHLHQIVVQCGKLFIDAGNALREIRDRELWRAGDYSNWNSYCESVQGITRRYANMLIATSEAVVGMREVGNIFPTSPSRLEPHVPAQVIPLLRIKDPHLRLQTWDASVERSGGRQPKVKIVAQVTDENLQKQDQPGRPAPTPKQTRAELLNDALVALMGAIEKREDWDLAAQLALKLKSLLRPTGRCHRESQTTNKTTHTK